MVYLGLQRQVDYPHEKEHFPFAQLATAHASRLLTNMIKKKKNVTRPRQGRLRGWVRIQVIFVKPWEVPSVDLTQHLALRVSPNNHRGSKQYQLLHMQTSLYYLTNLCGRLAFNDKLLDIFSGYKCIWTQARVFLQPFKQLRLRQMNK